MSTEGKKIALVLSGGGARAAYQAGVLRALSEILPTKGLPFSILSGVSAGSINVAYLACCADDFGESTKKLWHMWESITSKNIFRLNGSTIAKYGLKKIFRQKAQRTEDLFGTHFIDNQPLYSLLTSDLDFHAIRSFIRSKIIHAVAFGVTNYDLKTATIFFDGSTSLHPWVSNGHFSIKTRLGPEHAIASAAIPFFFPSVLINSSNYGDGGLALKTPLAPAIHLGAEKIFSIDLAFKNKKIAQSDSTSRCKNPPNSMRLVDILGMVMNSVFMTSIEVDLARLLFINRLVARGLEENEFEDEFRNISAMLFQPSQDLGSLCGQLCQPFPFPFRNLLSFLGANYKSSCDLLSFLTFEAGYTSKLLKIGYDDAFSKRDALESFFLSEK